MGIVTKHVPGRGDLCRDLVSMGKLFRRGEEAKKTNTSLHVRKQAVSSNQPNREQMSERAFVRAFGDKVKNYRLSNRADFVGLLILGKFHGIIVTSDESGVRKVRLVDIEGEKWCVTHRYLRLRENDSLSNLQRGLLKYVR